MLLVLALGKHLVSDEALGLGLVAFSDGLVQLFLKCVSERAVGIQHGLFGDF